MYAPRPTRRGFCRGQKTQFGDTHFAGVLEVYDNATNPGNQAAKIVNVFLGALGASGQFNSDNFDAATDTRFDPTLRSAIYDFENNDTLSGGALDDWIDGGNGGGGNDVLLGGTDVVSDGIDGYLFYHRSVAGNNATKLDTGGDTLVLLAGLNNVGGFDFVNIVAGSRFCFAPAAFSHDFLFAPPGEG